MQKSALKNDIKKKIEMIIAVDFQIIYIKHFLISI